MTFKENIFSVLSFYRKILGNLQKAGHQVFDSSLIVSKSKKGCHLYLQKKDEESGKFRRKYLKKDSIGLARAIAQSRYEEKLTKLLQKRIRQLEILNRDYEDDEIENLYLDLSEERRKLVKPVILPYEEEIALWKSEPYLPLGFREGTREIYTNKGEKVRSKTEKILADKFDTRGIAYKYEKPLKLANNLIYYPDFTFLSPSTRQEIYWEHLGMMDDPNYANAAMVKIRNYETNGYFRGEKLILTFESSSLTLDDKWVDTLINTYLQV